MFYKLIKVHFWNTLDNIGRFMVINLILVIPFLSLSYSVLVSTPKIRAYIKNIRFEIEYLNIKEPSVFIVIPQYIDINTSHHIRIHKVEKVTDEGITVFLATKQKYRLLAHTITKSQKTETPVEKKTLKSLIYGYGTSRSAASALIDITPVFDDIRKMNHAEPIANLHIDMKKSSSPSIVSFPVKPQKELKNVLIYYILLFFVLPLLFFSMLGGIVKMTYELFLERSEKIISIFTYIKKYFVKSFLISLFYCILFIFCIANILFYPKITLLSTIFSVLNVWFFVFLFFSFLWVFPIQIQVPERRAFHAIKMSFLVFFDNIILSIFITFYAVLLSIVSICTAFLIPGIASITSFLNITVYVVLLKYDFLKNRDMQKREKLTLREWGRVIADNPGNIYDKLLEKRGFRDIFSPWRFRDMKR